MFSRESLCKQEGDFFIFLTLSIFFLSIHRLYLILKIFGTFFCKLITFKWYLNASGSDTGISLQQNNSCLQKMPMYLFQRACSHLLTEDLNWFESFQLKQKH